MEGTSSTKTSAPPLRDEGLLALMRALPQDILGKVVLSFLSISDEKRLWAEESAFRTVYTWCMAAHRESGLRRRREGVCYLIRSTIVVFFQDGFDWTSKVGCFRHRLWRRKKSPYGAVRDEWDMVKHGDIVLKHLCETGAVACDADTLAKAAFAGSISTVRYLVEERGVDPAALNNCAFRDAAQSGHAAVLQFLLGLPLERGVDPSARNNYALCLASEYGNMDVVQLLLDLPLERGVDPAAEDNFAFRRGAKHGHTSSFFSIYRWTVASTMAPTTTPLSAMLAAAKKGHADIAKLFLNLSPDRRPSRAVVQNDLSVSLRSTMSVLLAEHLKRRKP